MRELKSIEEKILDRTLYLIGKNGSSNVSIRAIAKEAGVNVSAINYYFRTKEEMLNQVKEFYINNTLSAYAVLDNEEYKDEEKLIILANEIMEYAIRYPGVIVILKEAANERHDNEVSQKIIDINQTMNEKMDSVLAKVFSGDKASFEFNRLIFLSSILHPINNIEVMDFDKAIVEDKEFRLSYISHIIKTLKRP